LAVFSEVAVFTLPSATKSYELVPPIFIIVEADKPPVTDKSPVTCVDFNCAIICLLFIKFPYAL
jgi:hypothetical protein